MDKNDIIKPSIASIAIEGSTITKDDIIDFAHWLLDYAVAKEEIEVLYNEYKQLDE